MPEYIQSNLQGLIINKWYSADPSIVDGLPNILKIPRDVFNALTKYHIVDAGVVREMTQAEKDQLDAWEAQKVIDAENARLVAMDDRIESSILSGITLTKIDNAIDNIGSLEDAKVFLKKLCRYIVTISNRD